MSKKEYITDIIRLLRIPQLFAVAAVQLVIHFGFFSPAMAFYGGEPRMGGLCLSLCVLSTVLIALSGFLANDYFDSRIDKVNRPLTRIVEATISRGTVFNIYVGVTGVALILAGILAFLAHNFTYFFIFAIVIGLVWFYSASYKRVTILGNAMFALAFAMIPLTIVLFDIWFANLEYGGMTNADIIFSKLLRQGLIVSGFAFGYMFVYDIVRGMEEEKGERELECRSLCIVFGRKVAKVVVIAILALLSLALSWCFIQTMNYTAHAGLYFAFFILSLTIALCVQVYKSKVRFDFLIIYGLIYSIIAVSLIYLAVYGYYLE